MSTFEDIYCSQCNCKTDQALMLSCEHNLCMNCAAKNLNDPSHPSNQYIICDICGSKTEIDNQTSQEIFSSIFKNLNLNPNLLNTTNNVYNNNLYRNKHYIFTYYSTICKKLIRNRIKNKLNLSQPLE